NTIERNQPAFDSIEFRVIESQIDFSDIFAELARAHNRRRSDANRKFGLVVRTDNQPDFRKRARQALLVRTRDVGQKNDAVRAIANPRQNTFEGAYRVGHVNVLDVLGTARSHQFFARETDDRNSNVLRIEYGSNLNFADR